MNEPSIAVAPNEGTDEPTNVMKDKFAAPVELLQATRVVLDTQTFYNESFRYNTRHMKDLLEHAAAGRLQVYITDINEREVHAGIRKRVDEASEALSGKVRRAARILENLESGYDLLFNKDAAAPINQHLLQQYEEFKKAAGIQVISSRDLTMGAIFDRYFETRAPFEATGDKKSEFPDAASVAAIIEWASREEQQAYVVSGDGGMRTACAECQWLLPLSSLAELLARATATHRITLQQSLARAQFDALEAHVRRAVITEFESLSFFWTDYEYGNAEIHSVTVDDVRLSDALLTDIDESIAYFELQASIRYEAKVHFDDPDATRYDREDGEMHVYNRIHGLAKARAIVPVTVEIEYDASGVHDAQIMQLNVNDDQEVAIVYDEMTQTGSDVDDDWSHSHWGGNP